MWWGSIAGERVEMMWCRVGDSGGFKVCCFGVPAVVESRNLSVQSWKF